MTLWIRVGDGGEYEAFDSLDAAMEYLNALAAGRIDSWVHGPCAVGFETPNFWGHDCISCYWGDDHADLIRPLSPAERDIVEAGLLEVYN